MNCLYSTSDDEAKIKFVADSTNGGSFSIDNSTATNNSAILTLASASSGTPFTIRLLDKDELSSSSCMYFEMEVMELVDGNVGVGIVTEQEFLPGWKTKGMFYNGNITNGSAGLIIGFGKHPQTVGDVIGVYVIRSTTDVKTVFYMNGLCLGTGFQLVNDQNTYYPCLHFSGKHSAVIKYTVSSSLPTTIEREQQHSTNNNNYDGDWILKKAFVGPELTDFPLPTGNKCILSFSSTDEDGSYEYNLAIKVGNTIRTRVTVFTKNDNNDDDVFENIQVKPPMSSMMMPPPELYNLESYLTKSLPTLFKMIVSENAHLIMTGPTAELICHRYQKTFDALTSYHH